jgi:quercetin dioxygenase-like cupin family protein
MEREMENRIPSIIDLNAELAKLTMFRGLTPITTREERRGSATLLGPYRDGILFAGKNAGTSHWEDHAEDELVHVLDGTKILDIVCDDGPPKSFEVRAGMIAIVPKGTWHRFRSAEGGTTWSATLPGDHIELDVDDPRMAEPKRVMPRGTPSIIDLNAELAKLTMFRGRTPQSTMADRKGSAARLASYRDGGLSITKFVGKGHWETPSRRRRADPHPRWQRDSGNGVRRRTAQIFRARRRNGGCQSAGCVAPLSVVGGCDANGRHTPSQRGHRARCRRATNGWAQASVTTALR